MIKKSREHVRNWFDVIDLDPYGSASPFLDSAMASIQKGGLVCITCTDLSCLCGAHPAQCHTKYNAFPIRAKYCHEQALRIVLAAAERSANLHGKHIVPLASIFIDFYVRIFVQVFSSKEQANLSATYVSQGVNDSE
jgi:tRNA (guanine26-N2/guanine27-N2)-dimethyltransferase